MTKYKIKYITLHCSDSFHEHHDDISVIAEWHRQRGWVGPDQISGTPDDVGYNYFIQSCGSLQVGRKEGAVLAHAKGHNHGHIAICLHGRNEFTDAQEFMLMNLIRSITDRYDIERIYYHNELDPNKTCPNFKWDWIAEINEELQTKKIHREEIPKQK